MSAYTSLRPLVWGAILLLGGLAHASDKEQADSRPEPLPDPLTLEKALALADEPHPDLQIAEARVRAAEAELQGAQSDDDLDIYIEGAVGYVEPPDYALDQTNDENRLKLSIDKTLYDFGRTSAASDAAARQLSSTKMLYISARQQRRLEIMRRFFDVVLADMQFYRYNEEMAVEYVALDRLRDRRELNQVSDLDVLEQEAAFQRARTLRTQSQNRQRQTRARLALALNRPGELPSSVVPPQLPQLGQQLPEVEELQMLALKENPRLKALREQLEASLALIENARAGNNPSLSGRLEAGNYSREREQTRYGEWRAELSIKVPLYAGGRTDAGVAREKARMFENRSRLSKAELDVRQQVLELWLRLDTLKAEREQRQTEKSYRELYLDRSRALYELEVKTNLGDSMVRYTEAERNMIESDFEMALTWARLNALLGQLDLDKPFLPPQNLLQKDESNEQAQ